MRPVRKWLIAREIHIYWKVYFEYWHDEFYDTRNGSKPMAQILLLIVVKHFLVLTSWWTISRIKNASWTWHVGLIIIFLITSLWCKKGTSLALLQDLLLDGHPLQQSLLLDGHPLQQSLLLHGHPHSKVFYLTASPQNSTMRSDNCSHVRTPLTWYQLISLLAFLPFCLFAFLPFYLL